MADPCSPDEKGLKRGESPTSQVSTLTTGLKVIREAALLLLHWPFCVNSSMGPIWYATMAHAYRIGTAGRLGQGTYPHLYIVLRLWIWMAGTELQYAHSETEM